VQPESESSPLSSISPSEKQFFQLVVEGNNRFAFDFYHNLKNDQGNFCFSSYSVAASLAMAAIGAKGETAQQFQHIFHYSLSLLPLIGDLNELLQTPSSDSKNASQLWLANALWFQKDLTFLPSFKLGMQRNFKATLQLVDFANEVSKAIQLINQWVSRETKGKINSMVTGVDVTTSTSFILTSAVYMRGQWVHRFDPRQTKRLPFHVTAQRTFMSDMMHTTSTYQLWKGDKWDVLLLPYVQGNQGPRLAMTLLLPKKVTLEELESQLTLANWKQWLSQLHMQTVSLTLPRFDIEDRFDLNSELNPMGLTRVFSSEADFSGITGKKELFINKALHKTFVRVDEKGSEASGPLASSLVETIAVGGETPYEFVADHPFIFVIWDQKTDVILFMGRLSLP
jgi:serpin B